MELLIIVSLLSILLLFNLIMIIILIIINNIIYSIYHWNNGALHYGIALLYSIIPWLIIMIFILN